MTGQAPWESSCPVKKPLWESQASERGKVTNPAVSAKMEEVVPLGKTGRDAADKHTEGSLTSWAQAGDL